MPSRDRVALIIAKMKRGPEKKPSASEWGKPNRDSEDYSEPNVGLESAADDILSAIREGDASALVSALEDFLHIHASDCEECSSEAEGSSSREEEEDYP